VGERFWKLTRWGLDGQAQFDEKNLVLDLPAPLGPQIPAGHYRLISAARSETDYASTEAHLLRLSSPLGQWLLEKAKTQTLPTAIVRFDISHHGRKISMIQPLIGQKGWLRLDKLALDSDTSEEFLLLTAVTDSGQNLDQEQAQRLLDVCGSMIDSCTPDAATTERVVADADRLSQATLSRASQAGNGRFKQVQTQVNQWADDKIAAAELELETLRRELRAARREADLAETVQAQQAAVERINQLETQRRRARRNIDDVEDKVEQERLALLRQLQARSQQTHTRDTLFTIRFETV